MLKEPPKEYSFTERVEWMEEARLLLDDKFYPHFAYAGRWTYLKGSTGSVIFQRYEHIDVTMMTSKDTSVLIDEKIDSKNRSTIFCETLSDQRRNTPGWMVEDVSKSDVLLWAFTRKRPSGLMIYTYWLRPLIKWFWPRIDWFTEFPISNKEDGRRWTTIGRSVEIKRIPQELYFADPQLIERYEQPTLF